MATKTTDQSRDTESRGWSRLLYLGSLGALLLPFATVKGCDTDEVETFTGIELMAEPGGELLLGTVLIALVLFALSFRNPVRSRAREAFSECVRALASALAAFLVMASTGFAFAVEEETERIGYFVCLGCWWAIYILSYGRAFGQSGSGNTIIGVAIATTLLTAQFLFLRKPHGETQEVILGTLMTLVFLVPILSAIPLWWMARRRVDLPGEKDRS